MEILNVAGSAYEPPKMEAKPLETRAIEQADFKEEASKEGQNGVLEERDVKELVDRLNEQMGILDTSIRFGYNDKINSMFVNILEAKSGKVIRKIPTEEVMSLSEHLKELVGVIFDKKL